jgi:hypothetical protein
MVYDEQDAVPALTVVGGFAAGRAADSRVGREADRGDGGQEMLASPPATARPRLFCLVAAERADTLLPPLREHFAHEPLVAVVVERRRAGGTRRVLEPAGEIHRRAPTAERDPVRALPPELRHEARHLRLVQQLEPLRRTYEDADIADLVGKCLTIDPEAVSELWWRVSERALARLRLRLGPFTADDAARDLLGRILDELPGYQDEREPLTAWLDSVVDRYAEDHLRGSSGQSA